jgi:hypothetical protein
MRTPLRFLGIVLLLALGGGCDTTQPLQIDVASYQLEIRTLSQNRLPFYNVYYMVEDGVPDQVYLFCVEAGVEGAPTSIPWNFSATVEILRAGETVPEVIVSSIDVGDNMTPYDTQVLTEGIPTQNPITIDDGGTLRTFRFSDPAPRKLMVAHEEVQQATTNPLYEFDDTLYGLGDGLCSAGYPGPSGVAGTPLPLTIEIRKGDTLIVQARKSNQQLPGTGYLEGEPQLLGRLLLNGLPVQVRGDTVSEPNVEGSGISFSFTAL